MEAILLGVIVLGVVQTAFRYSQEGDILTALSKKKKISSLNEKEIVDRLHSIAIYGQNYVKWNNSMLLALFTGLILFRLLQVEFSFSQYLIVVLILFLSNDLCNRWVSAHVSSAITAEANMLYGQYGQTMADKK